MVEQINPNPIRGLDKLIKEIKDLEAEIAEEERLDKSSD